MSLSVTAWQGADMLGSRTLLRPGDRERTGGLHRDVPGADRLPKPGSLDAAGAGTLPPAPDHPRSPGIRSAAGHPGDVLEFLQHRTSRPGLPAHPRAVTHDQPYREGRRAACGMHDGRDISATAIQEDPVGGEVVRSSCSVSTVSGEPVRPAPRVASQRLRYVAV